MTCGKLKSIFQFYGDELAAESLRRSGDCEPRRFSDLEARTHFVNPPPGELSHLLYMCAEAAKFVDEGRVEKAMRWLGFLQGVFWARGIYSLDELKNHSRPDGAS